MKRLAIIGAILAGLLLSGAIGNTANNQPSNHDSVKSNTAAPTNEKITKKVEPTCDGITLTTNCTLDGVDYKTYVYHPAITEKTHIETVTTYQKKITGYCTLCNDGTYSPSCATGSGTCSHHDGVAQWNAPIYSNVPVYSTKTIIDAPAQEAYYEKVMN